MVEAFFTCLAHQRLRGEAPFVGLVLGCPREGARNKARSNVFVVLQLAFRAGTPDPVDLSSPR